MIHVGIIGTGFGYTQASVFSQLKNCIVEGICGNDYEKTLKIAKELGIKKVYREYISILEDKDIDLVCIASPNILHEEMFYQALKSHKHIILEKPPAITSERIKRMKDAAVGYDKLIIVDHEMRFNPIITKMKELIVRIGDISYLQISQYTNKGSDPNVSYSWMNQAEAGGGQILLMGTHLIDLSRYILDMPHVINGKIYTHILTPERVDNQNMIHAITAEEQFEAMMVTDMQCVISLTNTTYSFGYKDFEIKILGKNGIIMYSDQLGLIYSQSNDKIENILIDDELSHIKAGGSFVSKSFKYFADSVIKYLNKELIFLPGCSLQEAEENLRILESLS